MTNGSLVGTASRVTNAIALTLDLQPPAVVEGEGFRQLIHALLPSHEELPSPSELENLPKDHHARGGCLYRYTPDYKLYQIITKSTS